MIRVEARTGALFGWAAVAVWIVLYLVAALSTPGYSITGNRLSDLGNPAAPAHWAFNAACIIAGLLLLPFAWAIGAGLSRMMQLVGDVILSMGAVFLVGVGVFPEESPYNLHLIFSALFFLAIMVAISHFAVAMGRSRVYGRVSAILSVLASGLALIFVIAVAIELATPLQIAGGALSNVLEHLTVFAALAWASWSSVRLYRYGAA